MCTGARTGREQAVRYRDIPQLPLMANRSRRWHVPQCVGKNDRAFANPFLSLLHMPVLFMGTVTHITGSCPSLASARPFPALTQPDAFARLSLNRSEWVIFPDFGNVVYPCCIRTARCRREPLLSILSQFAKMGRIEQWQQNITTYGMVPYMIVVVWFFHRVGDRNKALDWPYIEALFRSVSPYFWASLGMFMSISMSVLGAAWCVAFVLVRMSACCSQRLQCQQIA